MKERQIWKYFDKNHITNILGIFKAEREQDIVNILKLFDCGRQEYFENI